MGHVNTIDSCSQCLFHSGPAAYIVTAKIGCCPPELETPPCAWLNQGPWNKLWSEVLWVCVGVRVGACKTGTRSSKAAFTARIQIKLLLYMGGKKSTVINTPKGKVFIRTAVAYVSAHTQINSWHVNWIRKIVDSQKEKLVLVLIINYVTCLFGYMLLTAFQTSVHFMSVQSHDDSVTQLFLHKLDCI